MGEIKNNSADVYIVEGPLDTINTRFPIHVYKAANEGRLDEAITLGKAAKLTRREIREVRDIAANTLFAQHKNGLTEKLPLLHDSAYGSQEHANLTDAVAVHTKAINHWGRVRYQSHHPPLHQRFLELFS